MPKRSGKKKTKRRDVNELAASIVEQGTGEADEQEQQDEPQNEGKNPAAVAFGRLGGKKGGPARQKKLSKKRRSEIAKKAARARWSDHTSDSS